MLTQQQNLIKQSIQTLARASLDPEIDTKNFKRYIETSYILWRDKSTLMDGNYDISVSMSNPYFLTLCSHIAMNWLAKLFCPPTEFKFYFDWDVMIVQDYLIKKYNEFHFSQEFSNEQ